MTQFIGYFFEPRIIPTCTEHSAADKYIKLPYDKIKAEQGASTISKAYLCVRF